VISVTEKIEFIQSVFGAVRVGHDGLNVAAKCPQCVFKDPLKKTSTKKKLIIRVDNDICHCWVCGYSSRSLAPLIAKFGTREQLHEYKTRFRVDEVYTYEKEEATEKQILKLPDDFKLIVLASQSDPTVRSIQRYLKTRMIEDRDIWFYRLGISFEPKWRRRVIIPSFSSKGELNYYVGRTIDERVIPKYDNVAVPKTEIIFNEFNIRWDKTLVISEGPFDMLKCGDNATCLLGSELSEEHKLFEKIILNSTPVVLSLDSDMSDKTERMCRMLKEYDIDVKIVDLEGHHDPGEMTKKQFKFALESATPWEWNSSFRSRLRALAS
jgi:hypothetical protein